MVGHMRSVLGSSPADDAAEFECVSALNTPALLPSTEPHAHAFVSACGRTPPVLRFKRLYRTGAHLVNKPTWLIFQNLHFAK
jgi:hypothetical protein